MIEAIWIVWQAFLGLVLVLLVIRVAFYILRTIGTLTRLTLREGWRRVTVLDRHLSTLGHRMGLRDWR